ncbi:hypothetical protein Pflav_060530 [Phytohabitans flavus]|uniref:Uncharacterized protein n=1 Tax=Phytohabitans flavus TaxID=1076124 RepID=A0A6F8Y0Q9_9ACTN|nr:hypothetical protein [Phytohabitans flavus]BCB79643.1 hypothetical protein Pflav_060530 [Phytohabitans flavus]
MPWGTAVRQHLAVLVGRRWVFVGVAVLLAAVTAAVLTLRSGPSPACAAPPTGNTVHRGKATFYDSGVRAATVRS